MKLDDEQKQLLRELGNAVNDTVSESQRIASIIAKLQAVGLDARLKVDVTVGLPALVSNVPLTHFLDSVHLRFDETCDSAPDATK